MDPDMIGRFANRPYTYRGEIVYGLVRINCRFLSFGPAPKAAATSKIYRASSSLMYAMHCPFQGERVIGEMGRELPILPPLAKGAGKV